MGATHTQSRELVEKTKVGLKSIKLVTDGGNFQKLTKQESKELGQEYAEAAQEMSPEMQKKLPFNFANVCRGSVVDTANSTSTCVIDITEEGLIEVNAVIGFNKGDGLFDVHYLFSHGKVGMKLPKKIELVKDTYGFWGQSVLKDEQFVATDLPLESESGDDLIKSILSCVFATCVGVNSSDFQKELETKAKIKTA